jgi:hypothetical protein
MEKDRLFEILHFSYRKRTASGEKFAEKLNLEDGPDEFPDWDYYICNLVFRATGEYDEYLKGVEHNFEEIEGKTYNGEPLYEWKTINNTGIDRSSLFVTGYTDNYSSFMSYNEKFDVFRFHEYLQANPATDGLLKFIEELKEGKRHYGICCGYHQFFSCLKSLEFFWD